VRLTDVNFSLCILRTIAAWIYLRVTSTDIQKVFPMSTVLWLRFSNTKCFLSVGPFYHLYIQKPVPKKILGNLQMRLISHRQQEPSELFLYAKTRAHPQKNSRFWIPSDVVHTSGNPYLLYRRNYVEIIIVIFIDDSFGPNFTCFVSHYSILMCFHKMFLFSTWHYLQRHISPSLNVL
jgi:hypothetical protein